MRREEKEIFIVSTIQNMKSAARYYYYRARANSSAAAAAGGSRIFNSPSAYLFGGLALLLAFVAAALVILTCSRWKNNPRQNGDQEKDMPREQASPSEADNRPSVVVIMAGDEHPTHLARPVIASSTCR